MANEKRLIDANEFVKHFWQRVHDGEIVTLMDAEHAIINAPTVDAVEVVHGYWIARPLDNFRKYEVKCSECGFVGIGNYDQYLEPYDFNYCPNCGAKMVGDGNG